MFSAEFSGFLAAYTNNNGSSSTTTSNNILQFNESLSKDVIYNNNNYNGAINASSSSILLAISNNQTSSSVTSTRPEIPIWLIPCYSILLLAAIIGNLLVISTLVQNRRMRTITNVFLLNLAISDILLGVLCMPVTLVGTLLRRFIFGEFLCKLIQFSQATSVAVSSWTLVAISCERYYAICHPLRSRTWQTISHAYKIIGFIWIGSIVCMVPIAIFSQLIPTSRQGLRKCREVWPQDAIGYERFYNILLDLLLLVLPLMILCVAYILITRTLYVGMRNERAMIFGGSSKVNTQGEAVATVTTTLMPSTGFNLNMSFRCFTAPRTNSVNNVPEAYQQEHQLQQQQQRKQRQQLQQQQQQSYDDISQSSQRKLLTDGRKQFYCMRSSSLKSLNRNFKKVEQGRGTGTGNGHGAPDGSDSGHGSTSVCSASTSGSSSQSMTVINVPHQQRFQLHQPRQADGDRRKSTLTATLRMTDSAALRRSNETKNLESKKRVVKMLFVLVLEFFICWTPLYIINTATMFIGQTMYEYVDYTSISFFQLLAYSSSCCNPITYCFMNAGFRRAFVDTFKGLQLNGGKFWSKRPKTATLYSGVGNSIALTNSVTLLSNQNLDSPRR